ncbi:deoxyribodipyrimidine photo-lyase [Halobacteriovorax sp. GB3]|uniref:cryptochrome/photolyase family protein n=1 Tax=Halobacteriovorax sp. GB3 TaxID=2719615 RepID=UPI00235DEFDF|nr:deoxyribodipyrimidine photo-lyase [Halobacteriovorax sp. GB3]MDD0851501.1 deoxyribodipyrimidine photo-lyase [Halobacteriovorax sp. GB3]
MKFSDNIVWLRRDLRLDDNTALSAALSASGKTTVIFIFDKRILDKIKNKEDRRISFIYDALEEIEKKLQEYGSSLRIFYGDPVAIVPKIMSSNETKSLFFNRDYEPYALKRDTTVQKKVLDLGKEVKNYRDHVIFERRDLLKSDGTPYKVFTPYSRAWKALLERESSRTKKFKINLENLHQYKNSESLLHKDWMNEISFDYMEHPFLPGTRAEALKTLKQFRKKIEKYDIDRDYPEREGTSGISPYLRFGQVSIREALKEARSGSSAGHASWENELIWREFYQMILFNFPHVEKRPFKLDYEKLDWKKDNKLIKSWKEGNTGVPIVDAAMRELNQFGTMPNRLRMVTASYFCKILMQDWRIGEEYFAQKLMDFDLAANNGGWQWSSSTGCDAAPYFRIFNPYNQSKKFDPDGAYIKSFCPELKNYEKKEIHRPDEVPALEQEMKGCLIGRDYPSPIVDYKSKREECLIFYKSIK